MVVEATTKVGSRDSRAVTKHPLYWTETAFVGQSVDGCIGDIHRLSPFFPSSTSHIHESFRKDLLEALAGSFRQ
jgi:hypothetical protein